MSTRSESNPIRVALQRLWDLNVKLIPSAIAWAVSFWFVIESHSFVVRSLAIVVASVAATISSDLINKAASHSVRNLLRNALRDGFIWESLIASGLLLDMALQNLSIAGGRSEQTKIVLLAIFLSSLLLWLVVLLIIIPLRRGALILESPIAATAKILNYVRFRRRYVFLSFSIILFAWPIFFVYMFLALTFAQCVIISSYENLVDASVDSPKMSVQIA